MKQLLILFFISIAVSTGSFLGISIQNIHNCDIVPKESNYILTIDYPYIENDVIREKICNDIDYNKKLFISKVSQSGDMPQGKYEFNVQNEIYDYKDVEFVELFYSVYLGGEEYEFSKKYYRFVKETGEEINLFYFLDNENSLQELSSITYYYISHNCFISGERIATSIIKDITSLETGDYRTFELDENGLKLIFNGKRISNDFDDELIINIPYLSLINIVKNEYLTLSKEYEEKIVENAPISRDLSAFEGKKLLAFTFDDGPNTETTGKLLDNLDKYNARVTFFVVGNRVNSYKNVLLRAYRMGNQIGSHTYSHLNLLKVNDTKLINEVQSTDRAIENIIGEKPILMRPPYGNISNHIRDLSDKVIIIWNVDTLDWKTRNAESVKEEILRTAKDGNIILLHDLYESSIDGALMAMEELEEDGYAFVTIDEMIKLKGIELVKSKNYYSF